MAEADTQMYQAGMQQHQDPLHELIDAIKLRNAVGNLNKVQGGMPETQQAMGNLGAGQPYPVGAAAPVMGEGQ